MSVKMEIIERLIQAKPLPRVGCIASDGLLDNIIAPDELPDNIADWPDDWRDEFEERAAIMEFDGHLRREEAEQWAETIVRAAYELRNSMY